MGLLKRPYLILALVLGALFPGCGSFRVGHSLEGEERGSWVTEGGNAGRENRTLEVLDPPLEYAWSYDAGAGFAQAPAVIADSVLFLANLIGEVHAVRLPSGEGAGNRDFGPAVAGSPVISGDTMYVPLTGTEDGLLAYNLRTGAVLWTLRTGEVESSLLALGSRLFVAALEGKLHCIDRAGGKILWSYSVPERERLVRATPSSDGQRIYFGTDGGSLCALASETGFLAWEVKTRGAIRAAAVVSRGMVFAGSLDSTLYALDAASGRQVWARALSEPVFAPVATDAEHVYAGTSGGSIACLDAANGDILWRVHVGGPVSGAPLAAGSVLYVGCMDKTLYAIDTRTGDILWQYAAERRIVASPLIWHEYLFLFCDGHTALALRKGGAK